MIGRLAVLPLLALATGCGVSMPQAVQTGNLASVRAHLDKGADPSQSIQGISLLCTAIDREQFYVAELLLERGARVDSTCMTQAVLCSAIVKHPALVSPLLDHGASADVTCGGLSPLGNALQKGNIALAEKLLAKGANPAGTDSSGSMLRRSLFEDSGASAQFFFAYLDKTLGHDAVGAMIGTDDLAYAVRTRSIVAAELLLSHGANPNRYVELPLDGGDAEWVPYVLSLRLDPGVKGRRIERLLLAAGAAPEPTARSGKTYQELLPLVEASRARIAEKERDEANAARERAIVAREAARVEALEHALKEDEAAQRAAHERRAQAREDEENRDRMASAFLSGIQSGVQQYANSRPAYTPPPYAAGGGSQGSSSQPATGTPTRAAGAGAAENQNADRERRLADEKAERERRLADEKAERERREADAKAATKQRVQDKLSSLFSSIQLSATKCTGGDGAYFVKGSQPGPLVPGLSCISVSYRASCPDNVGVSEGRIGNYVGASCAGIGDSPRIQPALKCPVERVTVQVTNVQPCSN